MFLGTGGKTPPIPSPQNSLLFGGRCDYKVSRARLYFVRPVEKANPLYLVCHSEKNGTAITKHSKQILAKEFDNSVIQYLSQTSTKYRKGSLDRVTSL